MPRNDTINIEYKMTAIGININTDNESFANQSTIPIMIPDKNDLNNIFITYFLL